jgi:hypothetical protein
MQRIQITIEGTTPLICNRFTDEAAEQATSGRRAVSVGDRGTPREQAEKSLYHGIGGELMIPSPNLFRCIIDAGKFHKQNKRQLTTQTSSQIPSCIDFGDQVEIKLIHNEPWEVDTRAVRVPPRTGGRILRHRPAFQDWALSFSLDLNTEAMHPKMLRDVIDDAGSKIGLGDFRPDCKGMYGKFKVTRWEAEEI